MPLVFVAMLGLAGVDRASAEEPARTITLDWSAPADCAAKGEVLGQVNAILGHAARHEAISAVAIVTHAGERWRAALTTTTRSGEDRRVFDGDSCSAVAHAVAVIVALGAERAVDDSTPAPSSMPAPLPPPSPPAAPAAPSRPPAAPSDATTPPPSPDRTSSPDSPAAPPAPVAAPAPAPAASSSAPAPAAPVPPAPVPPAPHAEPTRPRAAARGAPYRFTPRLALAAAASVDTGSLPSVAPGGEFSIGFLLVHAPWTLRADAFVSIWAAERASLPSSPGVGGDFSFVGVGGRVRGLYSIGRLALGPSTGLESDLARATSFGARAPSGNDAAWGVFTAGGTASVTIAGGLSVTVSAEAAVPLARPTFVVTTEPSGTPEGVFRPAAAFARASAGLEVIFF